MILTDTVKAILLGIVEGLTEFLPVSSTGHLLLAQRFLGLDFADPNFSKTFDVLIQLGAVLAILLVYARKLVALLVGLPRDPSARRFVLGVVVAFLPAAVIGGIFGSHIKAVLFDPLVVCCALVAGGLVLLVVDGAKLEVRRTAVEQFSLRMCLVIGFVQCLAMIPGVSRSGSSIVGAMLLGADKRSAAEFSFWLAMPTMAGAFAYDLYKNHGQLDLAQGTLIALGFAAAFLTGLAVVTSLLAYVSRRGFAVFGWWRIVVGGLGLFALGMGA